MSTVSINIKTDPEVKIKAQQVAAELGLSLSGVVNGYLKQLVRTKTVYFSLDRDKENPSPYLIKALQESEADRKADRTSPGFKNVQDAIRWLQTPGAKRKYGNKI